MNEIRIVPEVLKYQNTREFESDFSFTESDLVITNRYIFEPFFNQEILSQIIFQEDYGNGEPTDLMVEKIYKNIKGNPKRIIAIGGGTVIDIAKLFVLKEILPIENLFDHKLNFVKERELIVIPTTCGTGSEVTNISILSLTKRDTKKGLAVDELYPDKAVLIPEILKNLPFEYFGTSSIDALIHAVESALSPKATRTTKVFAYQAIELIIKGYLKIKEQGHEKRLDLLDDFLTASLYAGISFGNAGCGAVHALSYPLGAMYHVAHGEANYAMFTGVLTKYLAMKQDGEIEVLNAFLAKLMDCDIEFVYQELEQLLTTIIKKKKLSEYGINLKDLELFTDSVIENQQRLLANNYTMLSREDIYDIYKSLF